jgi:hypothetical protein
MVTTGFPASPHAIDHRCPATVGQALEGSQPVLLQPARSHRGLADAADAADAADRSDASESIHPMAKLATTGPFHRTDSCSRIDESATIRRPASASDTASHTGSGTPTRAAIFEH